MEIKRERERYRESIEENLDYKYNGRTSCHVIVRIRFATKLLNYLVNSYLRKGNFITAFIKVISRAL